MPALESRLPDQQEDDDRQQHHRRNRECHGGSPPGSGTGVGDGGRKSIQWPAGSYPPSATDHNYPCRRIDRCTAAQGGALAKLGSGHDDRAAVSFPRQHARTQRFTLGAPRAFTVSPGRLAGVFLRSASGTDRANRLWVLDTATGEERVAADPAALLGGVAEELSAAGAGAARAQPRGQRRASSATRSTTAVELAAFALSGRLFVAELRAGHRARALPGARPGDRPAALPRRAARRVRRRRRAAGGRAAGGRRRPARSPSRRTSTVTYGLAEFIAAEEMGRSRGFWWSPESRPAAGRAGRRRAGAPLVDRRPGHPGREPREVAYPAAGTPNARGAALRARPGRGRAPRSSGTGDATPTSRGCTGPAPGAPLLLVQARDQRSQLYLAVDPETGATRTVHADEDPHWLDLFPGVPAWTPDGRLVRIADEGGARVLAVGDRPLTGAQLHVRAVLDVGGRRHARSRVDRGARPPDPEIGEVHVYRVNELGSSGSRSAPGVHSAVRAGRRDRAGRRPRRTGRAPRSGAARRASGSPIVASYADDPVLTAQVPAPRRAHGASRAPCCSRPGTRTADARSRC